MKVILLLLFSLSLLLETNAQTITARDGGGTDFWDEVQSWIGSSTPTCGSHTEIIIPAGVSMVIRNTDIVLNCGVDLIVNGTLRFGNNQAGGSASLSLGNGSTITLGTGAQIRSNSGGAGAIANNSIQIDGNEIWNGDDGSGGANHISEVSETTYTGNDLLPIELKSFTAMQVNNYVSLNWQTFTEINNDFFTILRSRDGEEFESIGKVPGAGNSAALMSYSFIDYSLSAGNVFYKLKQTDFDGKSETFDIVTINVKDYQGLALKIYPNPAIDQVFIESSDHQIQFLNSKGEDLTNQLTIDQRNGLTSIDLNWLPKGVYYLVNGSHTQKLIKQ